MRIGIVTTWFERGASYVSKAYMEALQNKHSVFIFARGGEACARGDLNWDRPNVYWGKRLAGTSISFPEFRRWVAENKLDLVFFNEQSDWRIIVQVVEKMPSLVIGSYIDYYTEKTLPWFNLFDFVICNTRRHLQAFQDHENAYYIPWGTDINLFKPAEKKSGEPLTFFHSAGMSRRKGTELLLDAFINSDLGLSSRLIVHTQLPLSWATDHDIRSLNKAGVEVIEKTVPAPGLYHLGDVYVYPTKLDGLGLTMYEALACGMPIVTTDYPPMNEVVNEEVGQLVKVERNYSRQDAYYWPMSICDEEALKRALQVYVENPALLESQQVAARSRAVDLYNWADRKADLCELFASACKTPRSIESASLVKRTLRLEWAKTEFGFARTGVSWLKRIVQNRSLK